MAEDAITPPGFEGILANLKIPALAARKKISEWSAAETGRLGLWAPVALGAGAIAYFLLLREPAPWAAPLTLAAAAALWRFAPRWRPIAVLAIWASIGFVAADVRTAASAAPALDREIRFAEIVGRIVAIDESPKMRRLLIDVDHIADAPAANLPKRVRVSWRGKEFGARPGDMVQLRASLSPPPQPAAPGGFDFARQLYFQRIGAVGFAVSAPSIVAEPRRTAAQRAQAAIESMRVSLSRRILEKSPGDGGAIVAAVVTGKRGSISEEAEAAFRDSGLAHLLSISGLHMGLATGLIFFAVRALLALVETIALTQPIKKWAAGSALASGFAYLLISGAAWPAQRAFIMTSIFFIAIIADRRALSLRNVAIAAFVIILLTPEAVLHPGFQMSFAAVTALISFYEWASSRTQPTRSFAPIARVRRYFIGIAVTDTIAAAATAPYSLFHFSRAANFGLAANIISIPLMGFWVMPAAIAAMVLMPFGADGPFWRLASGGVDVMLAAARWTVGLPGAVTVFPHWPPLALGILTIGGLWLCLMRAPWRLAGVAALPVAVALILAEPHPDFFVSEDGENAGYVTRGENGEKTFAVFSKRKGRFDAEVWMEQAGIDIRRVKSAPLADIAPCDRFGCVVTIDNRRIAVSERIDGLKDDCDRADIVIALYPVATAAREGCGAALIDRRTAWDSGAHSIYVMRRGVRVVSASQRRGDRPWSTAARRTSDQYLRIKPTRRP